MSASLLMRKAARPTTPAACSSPRLLQRKCDCGGAAGKTDCDGECNTKRLSVQRHATDRLPLTVPSIVHDVLRSPGQPLDTETRSFMEPRFGHDFSRVRVHTGHEAAESAWAVNALAYTVGQDTVFSAGMYAPATTTGKKLLAHELAHTIQQGRIPSRMQGKFEVTSPEDASEREADAASEAIMNGRSAAITHSAGSLLSRQTRDESGTTTEIPPSDAGAVPMDDKAASACPVQSTGTLSEVSWGETSGLYPTSENKYTPSKWDADKTCELLKARGAVHAVGQRGESVKKGKPRAKDKIEQMLKIYHFTENFPALDSTIADTEVKWFYLSPDSDKPAAHPGANNSTRVQSYGSFYNIGGGDVKRGPVYIHFYKLQAPDKKEE